MSIWGFLTFSCRLSWDVSKLTCMRRFKTYLKRLHFWLNHPRSCPLLNTPVIVLADSNQAVEIVKIIAEVSGIKLRVIDVKPETLLSVATTHSDYAHACTRSTAALLTVYCMSQVFRKVRGVVVVSRVLWNPTLSPIRPPFKSSETFSSAGYFKKEGWGLSNNVPRSYSSSIQLRYTVNPDYPRISWCSLV